jgi:hypothetical protein
MELGMSNVATTWGAHSAPASAAAAQALAGPPLALRTVSLDKWDESIAGFDGVCQEQLAAFATARWPGVKLEPLLFQLDQQVVGGALIMIQPLPLRLGSIAVVKWAPMLKDATRPDAQALYGRMVEVLVDEYAVRRRLMLSILPHAEPVGGNQQYELLLARGFRPGARLLFPNRYIVNLRLDDAEQRKSFAQKWRYHLNKADKAGLSFEHVDASQRPRFDALYEQMVDRKKFPDHSAYDTVPALMALPEALRPELFFVTHEGQDVAGAIIFKSGARAVYLYGATTASALELRAGYFLHWHIIRWLRDNTRASWYDLGGTDGFQGLHQFKKGMVGDRGVIMPVPSVANYAAHLVPRLLGEGAFAARELVHTASRFVDRLRPDRAKPDQKRDGAEQ